MTPESKNGSFFDQNMGYGDELFRLPIIKKAMKVFDVNDDIDSIIEDAEMGFCIDYMGED